MRWFSDLHRNGRLVLWDWLHLLLLPIAFGLLPVLLIHRARLRPGHGLMCLAAVSAFGLVVIAGYAIPWAWTGFRGNTLWDWLHLRLLPLLLPTVIVPALTPLASARMIVEELESP